MRKVLLLFIMLLVTSACGLAHQDNEEKFVNQLFYEKLISISHRGDYTELTPSSIYIKEDENFDYKYNCKLINNQKTTISLKCQVFDRHEEKYTTENYTYTIKKCNQETHCLDDGAWLVYQTIEDKGYEGEATYIIPSESADAPNDKFVNPLFYKKLSPVSKIARTTFLTPSLIKDIDIFNQEEFRQCRMIANTPMFVTLQCYYYSDFSQKMVSNTCRYALNYCDEKKQYCNGGNWYVLQKCSGVAYMVIKKEDMGQQ